MKVLKVFSYVALLTVMVFSMVACAAPATPAPAAEAPAAAAPAVVEPTKVPEAAAPAAAAEKKEFTYSTMTMCYPQLGAESDWRTANTASFKSTAGELGVRLIFSDAQQK